MAEEKKVGEEIVGRLTRFAQKLGSSTELTDIVTVRKVKLNLQPRVFSAEEIRQTRKAMGLSQAVLSQFLGVPLSTFQDWEQGRSDPIGPVCRLLEEMQNNIDGWSTRIRELGEVTTA